MRLDQEKVNHYLKDLASANPAPGGGSASALVAATGVSLASMVARIIQKRTVGARVRTVLQKAIADLEKSRVFLQSIITTDARVYKAVCVAYACKKTGSVREKKIEAALLKSYAVMETLCRAILCARKSLLPVARHASKSIQNDVVLSALYLDASFSGAEKTAQINIDYIHNKKKKEQLQRKIDGLGRRYAAVCQKDTTV